MKVLRMVLGAVIVAAVPSLGASADPVHTIASQIGMSGYDPVTYFDRSKPEVGRDVWTAKHDGVTYKFWKRTSRDKFKANPVKYLPQFGGHCADNVRKNKIVAASPTVYEKIQGQLYLFQSQSAKNKFMQDAQQNILTARLRWQLMNS
ncbi:MAG: YHS domain-containing (seleno)protein [Maricaulaceae bacterium]